MRRGAQQTQPYCIRGENMKTVKLYRYHIEGGGVAVSPVEPPCEYTTLYRLIADDGKALTDGQTVTPCVDTENAGGWTEIAEGQPM